MPNLGQLVTKIRTDLNRGSDFDSRIRQAVSDTLGFYRRTRFSFNTRRGTFDLSASAQLISLSSDVVQVDSLRIAYDAGIFNLPLVTSDEINERDTQPGQTGVPIIATIEARQLRLYPMTDSRSYSIEITCLYRDDIAISASASDSASSVWFEQAEELVVLHSKVDVLENYIKEEESYANAKVLRIREELVLRELKYEGQQMHATGKIEPHL